MLDGYKRMANFQNTPNTLMQSNESRERLQKLVNSSQEVEQKGAVRKSYFLERQKELAQQEHLESASEVEKQTIADHEKKQLAHETELLEKQPEHVSPPVQPLTSASSLESQNSGDDTSPVNKPESTPKESTSPNTAAYWEQEWRKYIEGSSVHDPQVEKVILEVVLPAEVEVETGAAEQMYASFGNLGEKPGFLFETLVGLFPKLEILFSNPDNALSFEIVADEKEIRFWVVVPTGWVDYVERQIHGAYADAEITYADADYFLSSQGIAAYKTLSVKGKPFFPIRTYDEFDSDPLSSITSAMSKLREGERVILQVLIQPAGDAWRKQGQKFVQEANEPPKEEGKTKKYVDPQVLEAVQKKVTRSGFRVAARILVESEDKTGADGILDTLVGAFNQFSQPHLASFTSRSPRKIDENLVKSFLTRSFPTRGNYPILNTLELASLYHFPANEIHTPRLKRLQSKKAAPPSNVPQQGLYLGKSEYRNNNVKVHLQKPDRQRHMYIIGQTGSGKSEFLKYMAYQDIMNGDGIAFIDPHGEAVEDILQMVPKERAEDVIYFNPADTERPMGINILEAKTEEAKHRAVNSFIGLLYKLYDPNHTGIVGPQLERAVRNVMLTAMSEEGNTMIEVLKLLTNDEFAKKKIDLIDDPVVKSFWTEQMAQTSDFHKSETLGYFVSKFDRFVTEKLMRNIIGQPKSAFNFREIMDNQKILLVNLSKGMIGEENSNFLGLLLVPRILMAAMSRADMPKEDRKDFYLYVDEFQNFSTPDFTQILAEARKYKLSLIVANQYIAQIQEDIRNAVFGNVGSTVSFRVGVDDSEYLESQFEPVFNAKDLINQKVGECVTRLLINGQPSTPFSFKTDWPAMQEIPTNPEVARVIKEISRLKYGRDRSIVESEISMRAEF